LQENTRLKTGISPRVRGFKPIQQPSVGGGECWICVIRFFHHLTVKGTGVVDCVKVAKDTLHCYPAHSLLLSSYINDMNTTYGVKRKQNLNKY